MTKQTIYALSTVYGKSGVAVIRVSGTSSLKVIEQMTDININEIKPRYTYFTNISFFFICYCDLLTFKNILF